jgi:hypothetical protein
MLTNPASGDEVGSYTARVEYLQTYNIPLDSPITILWNGPDSDVPLLLLLARRFAYEALAEWQVRTQGAEADAATWGLPSGTVGVHIDVPRIIQSLEAQIKRAIDARKQRALRSRTLDI